MNLQPLSLMAILRWLALAAALAGTGCGTIPSKFVLGIYGVESAADLGAVRRAGFNTVSGPASREFLDEAHRLGVQVLAHPGTSAGLDYHPALAAKAVATLDRHPALWAWYLIDEPDLNEVHPGLVEAARRHMKSLRATKPLAIVVQHGAEVMHFGEQADVMLMDRYPIAWQPLSVFEHHVRMARLGVPKKPLYAIVQAFDWNAFKSVIPGETNLRAPTEQELRCMTYGALAQRADGLFYFTYRAEGWKMTEHPELWTALTNVASEVQRRRGLFEAEHLWWPWRRALVFSGEERFNEVQESRISLAWLRVSRASSDTPAGDYVLAVNNTAKEANFRLFLPSPTAETRVLGETGARRVEEGWIAERLAGYGVRVYGPLPPPDGTPR